MACEMAGVSEDSYYEGMWIGRRRKVVVPRKSVARWCLEGLQASIHRLSGEAVTRQQPEWWGRLFCR